MINLLPPEQKIIIESEYRRRYWSILGIFAASCFLIALLIASSLYFFVRSQHQAVEDQLSAKQNLLSNGNEESDAFFDRTVADLKMIGEIEQKRSDIFGVLSQALSLKPAGARIKSFLFSGEADDQIVELFGTADTRHSLIDFLEKLRADETFSTVDSPVSNLIKESNVDFDFKLHLNRGVK